MRSTYQKAALIPGILLAGSVLLVADGIPAPVSVSAAESPMLAMSMFTQDEPPPSANRPKLTDPPPLKPAVVPPAPASPVAPQAPPAANAVGVRPQAPAPAPPGAGGAPTSPVQTATIAPNTPTSPGSPAGVPRVLTDLTASIGSDGYTYDPKSRRDPFLSMAKLLKASQSRGELPPLQRVELSDVKLIGVVSDHSGYYGLIQTPDGKGYTVRVGTLMGTNNGTIKNIVEQKIIVAEPTLDVAGKMTTREIEILQRPKEGTE
jgi:Tfp pilus assembly protein PilP